MKRPAKGIVLLALIALSIGAVKSTYGEAPVSRAAPSDPFHALLALSRDLGPMPNSQTVSFPAVLHIPFTAGRANSAAALYDPKSQSFDQYQSPHQWANRSSGLTRAALSARAFLTRRGIATSWQPGSGWLSVSGPARTIDRVFKVGVRDYSARSGRRYYASPTDPVIPSGLVDALAGAGHISNYPARQTSVIPVGGLRPSDLLAAYNIGPLRARGYNGAGETIAFIEIDGFSQGDLDAFTQHFKLPAMHPRIAAGGSLSNVEGEADLDLQVAHEIAPRARLVVYNCGSPCSETDILQTESEAVQSNPRGIISISLGGCETGEGSQGVHAESNVFTQADALGESVFVASGDSGAYTCLDEDWGAAPSPRYIGVSSPCIGPGCYGSGRDLAQSAA